VKISEGFETVVDHPRQSPKTGAYEHAVDWFGDGSSGGKIRRGGRVSSPVDYPYSYASHSRPGRGNRSVSPSRSTDETEIEEGPGPRGEESGLYRWVLPLPLCSPHPPAPTRPLTTVFCPAQVPRRVESRNAWAAPRPVSG